MTVAEKKGILVIIGIKKHCLSILKILIREVAVQCLIIAFKMSTYIVGFKAYFMRKLQLTSIVISRMVIIINILLAFSRIVIIHFK